MKQFWVVGFLIFNLAACGSQPGDATDTGGAAGDDARGDGGSTSGSGNGHGDPEATGGGNAGGNSNGAMPLCTDGEELSVGCGRNDRGEQRRRCVAGVWEDEGDCDDPDECNDGSFGSRACGLESLGIQSQYCESGQWRDEGECLLHAVELNAGWGSTCALLVTGQVACWGDNVFLPRIVPGLTNAVAVSRASSHACALLATGEVACWGYGMYGRLGNGDTEDQETPVIVSDLDDAVAVSAGGEHTCAVRENGQVACWGWTLSGRLGNGETQSHVVSTPVMVSEIEDAVAVTAGGSHTCALREGGAVVCWGGGEAGQLGTGDTENEAIPTAVLHITDALEVSAGFHHTCALRTGGQVACWGANSNDGNPSIPAAVSGVTDAVAVTAGSDHTCAVRASGEAACWGRANAGRLGDGSTSGTTFTPVIVSGLNDATDVAAGGSHTCALREGGVVVCWGDNSYGQVGNGLVPGDVNPEHYLTPIPVRWRME